MTSGKIECGLLLPQIYACAIKLRWDIARLMSFMFLFLIKISTENALTLKLLIVGWTLFVNNNFGRWDATEDNLINAFDLVLNVKYWIHFHRDKDSKTFWENYEHT